MFIRHMGCIMQGIAQDELEKKLLASEGPKTQATKADFVKFHDDKVCILDRARVSKVLCIILSFVLADLPTYTGECRGPQR